MRLVAAALVVVSIGSVVVVATDAVALLAAVVVGTVGVVVEAVLSVDAPLEHAARSSAVTAISRIELGPKMVYHSRPSLSVRSA